MINITINNKSYKVKEAKTKEERHQGLKNIKSLPENEGMIFYLDEPKEEVSFTMKDCLIPLDIIFINQDDEVIDIKSAKPNDDNIIGRIKNPDDQIVMVLELNANSEIKIGDSIEFEEDSDPVMKVLSPDGTSQMDLWGGERIFSRKNTKVLIKKAKKADASKLDKDYKALGKYMFKCLKGQDTREPEYVNKP